MSAVFSRSSRYRGVDDVVDRHLRDPDRTVSLKALRVPPEVTGRHRHTVADGDRLDQLAFRYFQEPRRWWRICDANPEFLSPLDMLGRGPLRTVRIELDASAGDAAPPWAALAARLGAEPGVASYRFVDDRMVVVTHNRYVVGDRELTEAVAAAGFAPREPQAVGRTGKPITVPPDAVR
ncbi:MAG TPA: hypothetical protein VHF89_03395 [Solirubrobacteraceae bacterium]|nr:hypothetical protein [Solirubrobacteraceae bacterium]